MICNRCGTDNPEHSNFCVRCGNRLANNIPQQMQPTRQAAQQMPQMMNQPAQPPQPQPQQQSQESGSPFGGKQISDRHYSLEDIARQQAESNNEIGLASAPPERHTKHRKRKPPTETALPPIGSSDSMGEQDNTYSKNAPSSTAPIQHKPISAAVDLHKVRDDQDEPVNPLLPSMNELKERARSGKVSLSKPIVHGTLQPQSVQTNPLLKPLDTQGTTDKQQNAVHTESQNETTVSSSITPHDTISAASSLPETNETSAVSSETAVPAPDISAKSSAVPIPGSGQAAYRYTITTPPVPLKLQKQSTMQLFSGEIGVQTAALRQEYFAKKNAAQQ